MYLVKAVGLKPSRDLDNEKTKSELVLEFFERKERLVAMKDKY